MRSKKWSTRLKTEQTTDEREMELRKRKQRMNTVHQDKLSEETAL